MGNNNNISPEQLYEAAKLANASGMGEEAQKKAMLDFARSRMNTEQANQLNNVLSDADAVNRIMQSDQAKKILKKFLGNR